MEIVVRRASPADLHQVAHLFDLYRQFYEEPPDAQTAKDFIMERHRRNQSIILGARLGDGPLVGFVQIYPSFCSVAAAPLWVLYDLFVHHQARRKGIARSLLRHAAQMAAESGVARIELATATTNTEAQSLYESIGYVKDAKFFHYALRVT